MTAFCPKCDDEIAEDQVVVIEQTTFCAFHAHRTTIYDYILWRDAMPIGGEALCAIPAVHQAHNYWRADRDGVDTHCPGRPVRKSLS